ncbi:DNA cytosine methyltransferase [Flavobacterium cerinum]|uniref:DNA (cytosine-5-)-methyltransferase n=1 Tax=Flavobacterium cerinum TaxID=2502784 RepID=A0A3S3RKP3_9FLAO|nr:DNA cytosine methyltransferase [Flavobacterium cerinum]RWX02209.1 DNA cytosine methyltransferase [Flavobacterium cerinum]
MDQPEIVNVIEEISIERVNNFDAIDIFCGAGGLSLGAERAGLNIAMAVEKDVFASETFLHNHPLAKIVCDDICDINPLNYVSPNPFIVFGGPPCQGFSTSNTKTRSLENTNNYLFHEFLRFVNELQPSWFLFENVEGITSFDEGNTVKEIKRLFGELGYITTEKVLYASDYGVPQHRNRFIMVGNRLGIDFSFPEKLDYKISVKEAISDLPKLKNGQATYELPYSKKLDKCSEYAKLMRQSSGKSLQNFVSMNKDYVIERYKYIGQGQNWKAIPDSLMQNYKDKNNCHSGIYKRLNAKLPSVVISNYRKNMLIHPTQDRGLSVREAARLQSFPDNFVFKGSLTHIQQQIGNAVPPLLAEVIFKAIKLQHEQANAVNLE